MKKLLIALLVVMTGLTAAAQTYAYKSLFFVNPNTGVREQATTVVNYFTFTNNKQYCYPSDANGIKQGGGVYQYKGEKNGAYYYELAEKTMLSGFKWLTFSTDFKRLNQDYVGGKVRVLEYVADPNTANAPSQMY